MAVGPARCGHVLSRRDDHESGSAIFLFPAGLFVVLVLGAIVVDLTALHLASRQAVDAATAAAADAVAAGVDPDAVRTGHRLRIEPARAAAVARDTVGARQLPHDVRSVDLALGPGPDQVTVVVVLDVEPIVAAAIAGRTNRTVTGRGTATIVSR